MSFSIPHWSIGIFWLCLTLSIVVLLLCSPDEMNLTAELRLRWALEMIAYGVGAADLLPLSTGGGAVCPGGSGAWLLMRAKISRRKVNGSILSPLQVAMRLVST